MRIARYSGIAAMVILAAGCASPHRYSDQALENNLRGQLHQYGDLAADEPNVHIHSMDGNVTLSGRVRTEREREMIDAMVRNTAGVVSVNDRLQVWYPPTGAAPTYPVAPVYSTPPPTAVAPAPVITTTPGRTIAPGYYPDLRMTAATSTDEITANRISDRLRESSVPREWCQGVTISVTDGDAYVSGTVDNSDQKQAIISAVQRAAGVRAVYDQLRVR
ncbi:MAG: hypothetical protein C5B50_15945 [Verrucomicrobia bacterium]|nr:MAG: hypothetical protein C5B50_15945 [Verrucomicrobiota bacterium]